VCLYDRVRRLTALEDTGPRASVVDVTPSFHPTLELKSVECLGVCVCVCVCVCVSIPWSL